MTRTAVSLFASGGGKTEGARQAGYTPVAAIDLDPMAAACYAANLGDHIVVGDVADPARRAEVVALAGGRCDLLLASPPCQQSSRARSKKLPRREDADVGIAILNYVDDLQPSHVLIENVEGYRKEPVCGKIIVGLHNRGYTVQARVVDFADYGVPQHRRRLIIQARLNGAIRWPAKQTHIGWYAAIEDLIPSLPDSAFAPWQLARLPEGLRETLLIGGANTNKTIVDSKARPMESPRSSVTPSSDRDRAYVVDGKTNGAGSRGDTAPGSAPMFTIPASASKQAARAILIPGDNASNGVTRTDDQPMTTIQTRSTGQCIHRALLIGDQQANSGKDVGIIDETEPSMTMTTRPAGRLRAVLVHLTDQRTMPTCEVDDPSFTVMSASGNSWYPRAAVGRVVRLTYPALARLQTFPDDWIWPARVADACKVIGNAVPPKAARTLLEVYDQPEAAQVTMMDLVAA